MNSCRLCVNEFLVLRKDYNIHNLKDKLGTVFSFEITPHGRLSSVVCPDCVRIIGKFFDYAGKVKENQQRLLQQIEDEHMPSDTSSSLLSQSPNSHPLIPEDEIKVEMVTPEIIFAEAISPEPDGAAQNQTAKKNSKSIAPPGRFQKNLISRHMNMSCDICQEDQFTFQKLETHFKKYHGKQFYISCCGQKLSNEQMIALHLEKHKTMTTMKETRENSNSWERRVSSAFGSILTDFKKDLEDYEPLPNMTLALNGDTKEQQKLYDVQDYLVQTYFSLDCELCGYRMNNPDERRMHFRDVHPKEKYFVSCCGQRFSIRISIMRHLNRHWKFVANGAIKESAQKNVKVETDDSVELVAPPNRANWLRQMQIVYGPLMNEFRDDLIEGGFIPPTKLPEIKSTEQQRLLHQMQDYLIAKHSPLNCELCGVEISTYVGRREHFSIGHPKLKMYIECCGKKISTRQKVITHLLRHRKGLRTMEPQIRFAPEHTYEKHEQDDAAIEGYYKLDCELCDYTGNSYLGLRAHFQKSHKEEGFFITCCNRKMKTKYHILEHIAAHQKPGSLKCDHCEATFSSERIRKAHVNRKHVSDEEKLFRCEHCVESFSTKNLLVLHSYKHELMTCDICGVEMKRCSLRVHKLNIHKQGEEIVCHVCAKVFHSKHMFNAHYRKAHLGIRKKYKKKSRAKKKLPLQEEGENPCKTTTMQLRIEPLFLND